MSKFKRTLSVLLALVMAFSVMTVAFTVTGSAAPTVVRTVKTNPSVVFRVPQFLESYGSNYYARGKNLKSGGTIFLQVKGATDVALSCSDSAVSFSDYTAGTDSYTWNMQGGALESNPTKTTVVKWTVTYKVDGKSYKTEAWSSVKLAYGNPGFGTHCTGKSWAATHQTKNDHVEWIEPLYGNYGGASGFNAIIDMGSFNYISSSDSNVAGSNFAGLYFTKDGKQSVDSPVHATGNYYIDTRNYTNLSQTPMKFKGGMATWRDTDSSHPQWYSNSTMVSQTLNGSSTSSYGVTSNGKKMGAGEYAVDTFTGAVSKNSTVVLSLKFKWEGNITGAVSYHVYTFCYYDVTIVVYNKADLLASITAANAGNYQAAQMLASKPTDGGNYTKFKSWSDYTAALQQAWYIYGREDVKQSDIDAAKTALDACLPVYQAGQWVSGMMYAPADYSACDEIKNLIPTNFYTNYTDGTNGKYYKYSLASKVIDALADIEYDRPLDSRYQGTVDQMKQNLATAIANMDGQYKSATVAFMSNGNNVTNLPASVTGTIFGSVTKPADPLRANYRFAGWFYDEACTQAVTWPLNINVNNTYFAGNLNSKNDSVGTAFNLYAGWTLTGKKLSFVTNGDSSIEPVVGSAGEAYAGPTEIPTKAGYTFVGWYSDITLQNAVNWSTFTFGKYDTVYGKWEKAPFTVTFDAAGGRFANGTAYSSFTALYGDPVVAPDVPVRSGYGFVGWYYDRALTQAVNFSSFTVPSAPLTVYAKWSDTVRTVTFDANGGTSTTTVSYEIGAVITEPVSPTRAGFSFNGWYSDAALRNRVTFGSGFKMGADNITLYAGWNPLKYTITFSAGEGTMAAGFKASDYVDLDCGSVIVAPEAPKREGYVFKGWALGGEPYTLTVVPPQNLNLTAIWDLEPYTAHFRLATDVTGALSQGDVINATVYLSANYIVSNHSFIVYYDKRYLQPALNDVAMTTAANGTAAASKTPGKAYFTVLNNGGINVTDCGTQITGRVNNCATAVNLYYPASWQDNKILLPDYANYEYVYFNVAESNNGVDRVMPMPEQAIATFQFIVRDDAPLVNGVSEYAQLLMPYEFTKEAVNIGKIVAMREDGPEFNVNGYYDATYDLINNDIRFAIEPMVSSMISFVSNSPNSLAPVTAKVGKTIKLPTPTKAYHTFLGWTYTNDASDTNYVDANAFVVPENNVTLYAKWTGQEAAYYVQHIKQNLTADGWMTEPGQYEEETLYATIGTNVTAVPKNYEGFTCDSCGSGPVVGDTANALVLKVYYIRNSVTVTLNANGGTFTSVNQQTVALEGKYGCAIANPYGEPSRTGYTFTGWQVGNQAYTLSTYPANDMTVNAAWRANTYTLDFYLDGNLYTSLTGTYGSQVTAPEVVVGAGQVFSGWKNSNDVPFSYTTMPAKNESFYGTTGIAGHWLTLMVNGEQYKKIPIAPGQSVTTSTVSYTVKPGYTFSGWLLSDSISGAKATFPMVLTDDTTLYGFTVHEKYTISMYYYIDGELEYFDEVSAYYGDSFELPEAPDYTEYGYGFDGWYTDEGLTQKYSKPATMGSSNITLYGNLYVLQGTVKFDLNGGTGTAPADMSAEIGETITLPGGAGISKQYYKFGGWTLNKGSNVAVTSIDIEDVSTITVYAIWTVNYATINFSVNGGNGTAPTAIKAEVGTTVTALPDGTGLTRDGYLFAGWGTTAAATTAITSYEVTTTGNKTLFAVWAPLSCTLVAKAGASAIIDDEKGFIYGLCFEPTEEVLNAVYLGVEGNGHLEYNYHGYIGTGTEVVLVNDYSGEVEATYTIVIFGDIDGDGRVTNQDISAAKTMNAELIDYSMSEASAFAADIFADDNINNSDIDILKRMSARLVDLDQATRNLTIVEE